MMMDMRWNTLIYIPTENDPNVVYSGNEGEVLTALHGLGTPGLMLLLIW